ncbi:hydantoinase/oxoprolinase family protein [Thermogemmatispora tikiterensis]|uniref:Acetophenone carboxylase n=1 Tax=Thermogemmatispora tikiterensis TaxID=1825093 RepID=A0A328VFE2_9CHLR|nr:hydantoinase/oxoprolinase family protein [Thermogemmatispora tikiterensis]RAQ94034.1 acetophenone carboxylase [Thermogemmatispora tikiterensis]
MSASAMNSIDIDVGGTFTDMVLNVDGRIVQAKVPTTPYDLSLCFLNVIEVGAQELGWSLEELLSRVGMVRYSTTIAMNRLIERKGPRLALLTTEGHEDAILIGRGAQWIDGKRLHERRNLAAQQKPQPLIPRRMIAGIKERIDGRGQVVRPLDEEDAREKIHRLIDRGARGFVISLLWAFLNPVHERRLKEIIREEYKEYHIGYLPVVLSSDVLGKLGEYQRTMTAVLDAYLHRSLQIELSAMWDRLREHGYRGSFMMVQNSGGVTEIYKASASRTYNGGPVAGLIGARDIARQLGYTNVVASDVGGTSFDIGLVVSADVRNYEFNPVIDRWMVGLTMIQSLSIGAGGGSIARINRELGNRIEVGPQSAGSYPGPACYNQGGSEPTVTDADLMLGYLNPDYYFGGRMKLNKSAAERALRKLARPLHMDETEVAALIRRIVDENMASAIRKEVVLRGYRPEEFVLFAFGGGGPTHAAGYHGDIPQIVIFPYSPVFCALGSSIMDIIHVYEASHRFTVIEPFTGKAVIDREAFNNVVRRLKEQAEQELRAEGLNPEEALYTLELDMLYGGLIQPKRTATPGLFLNSEEDVWALYRRFEQEFSEAFSPLIVNLPGGVYIETFILKAIVPSHKVELVAHALHGPSPEEARKGSRPAYWPQISAWVDTPVYEQGRLLPGNEVHGPAILESEYTTVVIPPEMVYRVNTYGLGIMSHKKGEAIYADSHIRREAEVD